MLLVNPLVAQNQRPLLTAPLPRARAPVQAQVQVVARAVVRAQAQAQVQDLARVPAVVQAQARAQVQVAVPAVVQAQAQALAQAQAQALAQDLAQAPAPAQEVQVSRLLPPLSALQLVAAHQPQQSSHPSQSPSPSPPEPAGLALALALAQAAQALALTNHKPVAFHLSLFQAGQAYHYFPPVVALVSHQNPPAIRALALPAVL